MTQCFLNDPEVAEDLNGIQSFVNEIDTEENRECLLGDCGLAEHELSQEISSQYLESIKAGYKKR